MVIKSEKLVQNLQSLQVFLQKKPDHTSNLEFVIRELNRLQNILEIKKLNLQIVSNSELVSQALFDYLSSQVNLTNTCQIKLDPIPHFPKLLESQSHSILSMECSLENGGKIKKEFVLSTQDQVSLGKNINNDIVLDSSRYRGISWQHACLYKNSHEAGEALWQILDKGSTNGTFVNGKKIINLQDLKSGDEITLASSTAEQGIVKFIFNSQVTEPDTTVNEPYLDIINSDILMIVLDLSAPLSDQEKNFIQQVDTRLIAKQFIVTELLDAEDKRALDLEAWLQSLTTTSKFEILSVFLKPYYLEDFPKELDKVIQKKQDQFLKVLDNITKRQPENILASRLAQKLPALLEPIGNLLEEEKRTLQSKVIDQKHQLESLTGVNLKETVKKAIASVNEDKDKFFKKLKLDISQAKGAVLDSFSKKSIVYQIQEFVDNLSPTTVKREGQVYIQLQTDNYNAEQNINQILIKFCSDCIEDWANKEWSKITSFYGEGGICSLIKRAEASLNIVPSILEKTYFSQPQSIDTRNNLIISFVGINSEVRQKQTSLFTYLMKEIRSNLMQYMMMLTLLLSLLGLKAGKNQIFEKLSGWFKNYPWLLGLVIFIIFLLLMNAYQADNQVKLDEAGDKLKKETSSYYQSLSKNLLEKIIQEFNVALEYEAKKIDDTILAIQTNYNDYIAEIEKKQTRLQKSLEQLKEKEKNIEKDILEFQKLVRI
jgi:pSer/pThr/pTyr-binding forkhead associated (FHA) protein